MTKYVPPLSCIRKCSDAVDQILSSVTHIIHNAWTVNFNLPLQAFEDQLVGVRKLIDVRASAEHPIKLLVTSSIGITNGWPASNGPIPERPLPEQDDKVTTGYAASKSVIEQVSTSPEIGRPITEVTLA